MKIKGVIWLTQIPTEPMIACFGIVYGEDAITHERKVYIGAVRGNDEEGDALDIAECGAKLLPVQIKLLNDFLNPTKEN